MEIHSLCVDLVLNPEKADELIADTKNENDLFDLIVYLIYEGMNTSNQLTSNSIKSDDPEDNRLSIKHLILKLAAIKFSLFKIASYLQWDLSKIQSNLPTLHQEFLITEFKKFCEKTNNVPEQWKIFVDILFHRWVIYIEQKSTYPEKNNSKISNNNSNQPIFNPYFVSNEVRESLIKKIQNNCIFSVNELENYIKLLECGKISEIHMPSFDSFKVENKSNTEFIYDSNCDVRFDRNTFLEKLYYELACWNYIHEDYQKAHQYFSKIKNKSQFDCLDDYINITQPLITKNFKITEPKSNETIDKKLQKFLSSIIKEETVCFLDFHMEKSIDNKKIVQVFKKFNENCKTDEEIYLFRCMSKYLIFKLDGLYKVLDGNTKSLLLDICNGNNGQKMTMETVEEGEIDDEDITSSNDDDEFLFIHATDPELILSLIPNIKRAPYLINYKWSAPKYEDIILKYITLGKAELQKSFLILAKANELRNAKYFQQSRVLYLSLLEDIQTSHPMLAEIIRYELLLTDIDRVFHPKYQPQQPCIKDLEPKCLQFLRSLTEQNYIYFPELIESICIFLLEFSDPLLQEFINHPVDIVRFTACIAYISIHYSGRENKYGKEFWDLCLGSFLLPSSKYNFPKIKFSVSFADFVCKIKRNFNVIDMIANSLIKLYNRMKEQTLQQVSVINSKNDLNLSALSTNVLDYIDVTLVTLTIDMVLLAYLKVFPQETRFLRYYAEFLLIENQHSKAMKYFLQIIMYETDYFTNFIQRDINETIINQMIACCNKLNHHVLAGILHQFKDNPDYGHAFKEFIQTNYIDSSDDLYDYIWDVTLLEFLINLHTRRGEIVRKQKVIKIMSQLDINSNNDPRDLMEAAALRKSNLFRMLAKLYVQ